MITALFRKEWKQLRSLRLAGAGFILLLPLALVSIVSGAQRSWIPLTPGSNHTVSELFDVALPVSLVALWGLLALLLSSQSFAGDKGAGTEMFLMEMPVSRSRVWAAKWLATSLSILLQLAFGWAYWYFLTQGLFDPPPGGWHVSGLMLLGGGLAAGVICCLSAAIAAAFLQTPMHALLLGGVLAALPFGLSTTAVGAFPFAFYRSIPLPLVFPWLLLIGYAVGAYRITCCGEPLGRGKLKRGLVTLTVALLAIPVLFSVATPLAMRADVGRQFAYGAFVGSSSGAAAAVADYQSSGVLIDVASGERLRYLAPPIRGLSWNADGTMVAVIHQAKPLGGFSEGMVVEFIDDRGRSVRTVPLEEYHLTGRSFWAGDDFVVSVGTGFSKGTGLLLIPVQTGDMRLIEIDLPLAAWKILGPADDGSAYLFQVTSELPTDRSRGLYKEMIEQGVTSTLKRIDMRTGSVDPEILYEEMIVPYIMEGALSPSGKYWLRLPMGSGTWSVLDLETFSRTEIDATGMAYWMSDDRLAWTEQDGDDINLRIGPHTGAPIVQSWTGQRIGLVLSPDKRTLLVTASSEQYTIMQYWLNNSEQGGLIEITSWFAQLNDPDQTFRLEWAGPHTLGLSGRGMAALVDIDQSGEIRWIHGEP
jgi:ABC-type transport system involved in multi-copper enzyme maturation permease subunit